MGSSQNGESAKWGVGKMGSLLFAYFAVSCNRMPVRSKDSKIIVKTEKKFANFDYLLMRFILQNNTLNWTSKSTQLILVMFNIPIKKFIS